MRQGPLLRLEVCGHPDRPPLAGFGSLIGGERIGGGRERVLCLYLGPQS
jgi:hypothetical protein